MHANKTKLFLAMCKKFDIPEPVMEHKFLKNRKFRFDYAWVDYKIALEVEGGVWTKGRHTRPAGFLKDMEKYNLAAKEGWSVVRTTPYELCTIKTVKMIEHMIRNFLGTEFYDC